MLYSRPVCGHLEPFFGIIRIFYFLEHHGVIRAIRTKNRRLGDKVIRQFEEFRNRNRIQGKADLLIPVEPVFYIIVAVCDWLVQWITN